VSAVGRLSLKFKGLDEGCPEFINLSSEYRICLRPRLSAVYALLKYS
jgi:hypothetical protein